MTSDTRIMIEIQFPSMAYKKWTFSVTMRTLLDLACAFEAARGSGARPLAHSTEMLSAMQIVLFPLARKCSRLLFIDTSRDLFFPSPTIWVHCHKRSSMSRHSQEKTQNQNVIGLGIEAPFERMSNSSLATSPTTISPTFPS
jgi:hypothetical protein